MDERTLQKNLANLERELVNLQTAHEIGLGVVKYYAIGDSTWVNTPIGDYYGVYVLIGVDDGERSRPFLELFVNSETSFAPLLAGASGNRFVINTYGMFAYQFKWKIISTSKVSWHYSTDTNEARNWLNG